MLVLQRMKNEVVTIGDDVEVEVLEIRGDKVRLGITAPRSVAVHRKEVSDRIAEERESDSQTRETRKSPLNRPGGTLSSVVWWVLLAWVAYGVSVACAGAEEFIQPKLDAGRTVRLAANATYTLDAPLRVGSRAQLIGAGFTTSIVYRGDGDTAIILGDVDSAAYAYTLRDVSVIGGGVLVARSSDLCTIERLWIGRSFGAGITIDGPGDRLIVDRVVVRECGVGIHVRSGLANNGMIVRDCSLSANRAEGLLAETVDWSSAHLRSLRIEGGTIQGNQTAAAVGSGAEIVLRGAVAGVTLDGTWVELTTAGSCLRLEPSASLADPSVVGRTATRSPSSVHVRDCSLHPINPLRFSIDAVSMEGSAGSLRITDSDLRMPIRVGPLVPFVQQSGGRVQPVVVMQTAQKGEK